MGCFVNFRVFAYEWNTDVVKKKSHDKTQTEEIKEKDEKTNTWGHYKKNIISLPTLPERNY